MYTNFAINNNTNSSHGRRQETLKRLAKNVLEQANKKERNIGEVVEREYFTKEYIPAEVYIYNISGRACLNSIIKESLNFLNKQAALRKFQNKHIEEDMPDNKNELLELNLDDKSNIFAA